MHVNGNVRKDVSTPPRPRQAAVLQEDIDLQKPVGVVKF